jgi:ubiquinone/menaquinone biosynthesis C-methylase UbiE
MTFASPAPSARPSQLSFGYIPIGIPRYDIPGRLFGVPNALKRLQAPAVMSALDIQPGDHVLDFGCASGYMTVEMAKLAAKATGIDVNPYVETIKIPTTLAGRLEYIRTSGDSLPFADASFDRVLASEVLPMIPDPAPFLAEIRRVLKPGGRLVVVNGLGHPALAEAFATNSPRLVALARRFPERMPKSYADYCARFQTVVGTARTDFMSRDEIASALGNAGFSVRSEKYAPNRGAGAWYSWWQFELYLRTGKLVPDRGFLRLFARLLFQSLLDRREYRFGLILAASAPQ